MCDVCDGQAGFETGFGSGVSSVDVQGEYNNGYAAACADLGGGYDNATAACTGVSGSGHVSPSVVVSTAAVFLGAALLSS